MLIIDSILKKLSLNVDINDDGNFQVDIGIKGRDITRDETNKEIQDKLPKGIATSTISSEDKEVDSDV